MREKEQKRKETEKKKKKKRKRTNGAVTHWSGATSFLAQGLAALAQGVLPSWGAPAAVVSRVKYLIGKDARSSPGRVAKAGTKYKQTTREETEEEKEERHRCSTASSSFSILSTLYYFFFLSLFSIVSFLQHLLSFLSYNIVYLIFLIPPFYFLFHLFSFPHLLSFFSV